MLSVQTRTIQQILDSTYYRIPREPGMEMEMPGRSRYRPSVGGDGHDDFPRFAAIHRVLARGFERPLRVVNNGPSDVIAMESHMLERGDFVAVKEPAEDRLFLHKTRLEARFGPEAVNRHIKYCSDLAAISHPTPADIVYWVNPNCIRFRLPDDIGIGRSAEMYVGQNEELERHKIAGLISQYMSRDVVAGGYLVWQTDMSKARFCSETIGSAWETIYEGKCGVDFRNDVLPTCYGTEHFGIYRRLV